MNLFDVLFAKKLSGGGSPFPPVIKRVTGNPIEFTNGADAPLVKCVTQITGYQEGTGTPSPENVRPIVAYSNGVIDVGADLLKTSPASGITIVSSGNKADYNVNNTRITSAVGYSINHETVTTGTLFQPGTYTISIDGLDDCAIVITNKNHSGDVLQNLATTWYPLPFTFTIESEGLLIVSARRSDNAVLNPADYKFYVEKGSQVKHTTHTTTYPSAIYRGSEDVVDGTETHDMVVIDLGDLTYGKVTLANGAIGFLSNTIGDIKAVRVSNIKGNLVCSHYETKTGDQVYLSGKGISMWSTQQKVVIADQNYAGDSESDFKTAMQGVKLAYELATPTTSSVTPTNIPIKSLSGYNHIESSTGEMTIDYITDAYQNFVDTTERAIPSTRKGGVKAFDIFKTLDEPKKPEASAEESEPEEKEIEEGAKK